MDQTNKAIRELIADDDFIKKFLPDYRFNDIFDEEKLMTYLFYEILQKLPLDQVTVETIYNSTLLSFRTSLLRNVNLPCSSYGFLAEQRDVAELEILALNPAVPEGILDTLFGVAIEVVSGRKIAVRIIF